MAYTYDMNNLSTLSSINNFNPNTQEQSFGEKAAGIAVATTVDIGTTIWNSLIPEATGYEIETADALQKLGAQGALRAYEENREVVDALSFIGGVFIPGGAALKLARAVRAGIRGTNWLSQTRHFEDLKRVEKLVSEGAQASADFRKAKASIFLRGQANNAIDTVATEAAIIATFNEHPYMEDYLKDPAENFGISLLVGGTIGGGVATILNKAEINKVVAGVQGSAIDTVINDAKIYSSFVADNGTNALSTKLSIDNLDELQAKDGVSGLARQTAQNWKIQLQAKLGEIETDTFSEAIIKIEDAATRKSLTDLISDKRFVGVEKIDYFNVNAPLDKKKGLFAQARQVLTQDPKEVRKGNKVVFDPKHNAFLDEVSALQLGTIADLNLTVDGLKAANRTKPLGNIGTKFTEDVFLNTSAEVDKRFAADFFRFRSIKGSEYGLVEVDHNDISKLSAVFYGYKNRSAELAAILTDPLSKPQAIEKAAKEIDQIAEARVKIRDADGKVRQPLVATLDSDVLSAKSLMLRQMQANGVSTEVAAIKTNTPYDIVEAFYNTGAANLRELGLTDINQVVKYNSEESIKQGLKENNRLLSAQYKDVFGDLTVAERKLGSADPRVAYRMELDKVLKQQQTAVTEYANAKLFKKTVAEMSPENKALLNSTGSMDTIATQRYDMAVTKYEEAMLNAQKDFVDSTLLQYGNLELAASLRNDVVNSYTTSILRTGINQFVNAKGGNRFLNSADFYTRNMEEAGKIATEMGDAKTEVANRIFKRLITPVTAGMRNIVSKPELMTELGVALNVRASTGGKLIYKDGKFVSQVQNADGTIDEVAATIPGTNQPFQVTNSEVNVILESLQVAGREIYEQQKVVNQLKGIREPSDIGFWTPPFNPVNKHTGFVQDLNTGALRMFVGNSADELQEIMNAYPKKQHERIMTRDEVELYKISVHGDLLDDVTRADSTIQKRGIGLVTPDISPAMLQDVVEGIRNRIQYQATQIVENSIPDVFQKLDMLSAYNQRATASQGANAFQKAIKAAATTDVAKDVKDIILGASSGLSNPFMTGINNATNTVIQYGINTSTKLFNSLRSQVPGKEGLDYTKYMNSLNAAGIPNPFQVFDEAAQAAQFARAQGRTADITPQRLVNGANAFAATAALRFGELAQPLVNMLSLPILQMSAISRTFKAESIRSGADLLANSPMAIMYNGVRRMNSKDPINQKYLNIFKNEGLLESRVSETDDIIRQARFATGGAVSTLEKLIDNRFVEFMSKPSDYSDMLTRKATLMTAVELATKLYGKDISDQRMLIFARDFLKQTIGNYSAAQRPALFQGTFGAAAGLFQTYMLTYAQSMYRSIELQDYKGLGKQMLAQAGIFGVGSLPGFGPVSELIGEHFSDEHWDLYTGTYRALPDPVANVIMYGLPSNLGPAIHTRGDVQPRVPTGFSTFVAPSMIAQTLDSMVNVGKAIFDSNKPAGQAFMEALSMQSVSRPVARWSELISGRAVTREGSQIAGPAEVWSWQGSLARVFATRPLEEAKVRQTIHLNTVHGAIDSANRRGLTQTLKQLIRANALDNESLEDLAVEYLRTGTPQGFRAAVHEAMITSSSDSYIDLTSKLGDSPLMYMLEDIE